MRLAEQHLIRKMDARYAAIDRAAFALQCWEAQEEFCR
jgi:hypothetical protein